MHQTLTTKGAPKRRLPVGGHMFQRLPRWVALLPLVLVSCSVAACTTSQQAGLPQAAGPSQAVQAAPSKPAYSLGEPIGIRVTVNNITSRACKIATHDLALSVTALQVNGVSKHPVTDSVEWLDGIAFPLRTSLVTVRPKSSVHLALNGSNLIAGHTGFVVVRPGDPDGSHVLGWLTDNPGKYKLTVAYAPSTLGIKLPGACSFQNAMATTSFSVTASRQTGRTYFPAPGSAIGNVVGSGVAAPALATLSGQYRSAATGSNITFDGKDVPAFNTCMSIYHSPGGDPADSVREIEGTRGVQVIVWENSIYTRTVDGASYQPDIYWNLTSKQVFADGNHYERCAELYHELSHVAWDQRNKGYNRRHCFVFRAPAGDVDTGIPIGEVYATRAENAYRSQRHLPLMRVYGFDPLPAAGESCYEKPGRSVPDPYPGFISGVMYQSGNPSSGVATFQANKHGSCSLHNGGCEYDLVAAEGYISYNDAQSQCTGTTRAPPWQEINGLPGFALLFKATATNPTNALYVTFAFVGDATVTVNCIGFTALATGDLGLGGPQPGPKWTPGQVDMQIDPTGQDAAGTVQLTFDY